MTRDFFDPTPEKQIVVLIDAATLRKAEQVIESCEHCNRAEIRFDNILDRVTGSDRSVTDDSEIVTRGSLLAARAIRCRSI